MSNRKEEINKRANQIIEEISLFSNEEIINSLSKVGQKLGEQGLLNDASMTSINEVANNSQALVEKTNLAL
jgi:hypothetical protein